MITKNRIYFSDSGTSIEPEKEFKVVINRNGFRNFSLQNLMINRRIIYPGYSCLKLENDIALLEMAVEISWTNADPACFPIEGPSSYSNLADMKAIAAGWGATNEDISLGSYQLVRH